MTVIRVPRGSPPPTPEALKAAIESDRARQKLPANNLFSDLSVAGPYAITVDGQELDEYVVWER